MEIEARETVDGMEGETKGFPRGTDCVEGVRNARVATDGEIYTRNVAR